MTAEKILQGDGERTAYATTAFFFLAPRSGERTEVRGLVRFVAAVYDRRIHLRA
jgi:hypothetical protein